MTAAVLGSLITPQPGQSDAVLVAIGVLAREEDGPTLACQRRARVELDAGGEMVKAHRRKLS